MLHCREEYAQAIFYNPNKLNSNPHFSYIFRLQHIQKTFLGQSTAISTTFGKVVGDCNLLICKVFGEIVRISASGHVIKEFREPLFKDRQLHTDCHRKASSYYLTQATVQQLIGSMGTR